MNGDDKFFTTKWGVGWRWRERNCLWNCNNKLYIELIIQLFLTIQVNINCIVKCYTIQMKHISKKTTFKECSDSYINKILFSLFSLINLIMKLKRAESGLWVLTPSLGLTVEMASWRMASVDIVKGFVMILWTVHKNVYMLWPRCEIVHFVKWTSKLSISWNGQLNCPFHEMDKIFIHFVKWIKNPLSISWNWQLNVRNFYSHSQ